MADLTISSEYIAIGLSLIAIGVAFWQGYLSKQQLNEAKDTKKETSDLLDKIKDKVTNIESTTKNTEENVKQQVSAMIETQSRQIETLMKAPQQQQNNEMGLAILQTMMNQDPNSATDLLKAAMEQNKK